MHFSPEINLGTIISTLVFLGAVFGGIRKFGALEAKLNIMYAWFERRVMNGTDHSEVERFFGKQD